MAQNQKKDIHFWQGFKDLYSDPDFVEAQKNEFIHGADEAPDFKKMSPMSRRKFIALMGASAALAGAACTPYRDKGKIIPYVKGQEGLLPGIPNYYASTVNVGGQSHGVLIKTREGRPIKINGNPDHPLSQGKIPSYVQASIMDLYDPSRIQFPQRRKESNLALYHDVYDKISWKTADMEMAEIFKKAVAGNKEIAVISHLNLSPTAAKVFAGFKKTYPTAKFYHYELFQNENRKKAWEQSYGNRNLPVLHFDKANVIISIDGDFLGTDINSISHIREYTKRRDVVNKNTFNKFYMIEPGFSQSGLNADYRFKLKAGLYGAFLRSLITTIAQKTGQSLPDDLSGQMSLPDFANENGWQEAAVETMVNDILNEKENVLFYAGDQQSVDVHILVNYLNEMLGSTIHYDPEMVHNEISRVSSKADLKALTERMINGEVAVAIHLDSNPVYHWPMELQYENALKKVDTVISLAMNDSESVDKSDYVLPINHALESWGDASPVSGLYSLQQPVIEPLYDTRQVEDIFLQWQQDKPETYDPKQYHQFLMENWKTDVYSLQKRALDFERFWYVSLHDGLAYGKNDEGKRSGFKTGVLKTLKQSAKTDGISIVFRPSPTLLDGRYANNGWMQEIPHPVTKVTWDNYAAISLATARLLGAENDRLLSVEANGNQVKLPVFIQPGMADDTIVVEMGYGRTITGAVGRNVGVDVKGLMPVDDDNFSWMTFNAKAADSGESYPLASTQEHFIVQLEEKAELIEKREILETATLDEYMKNPDITKEKREHVFSITNDWKYEGNKWGMAIDLNKCVGCNDCVTSCNVENNIPVVGKDQVIKGREMHWMRIDRYYRGTPEEADAVLQPMLCQQCDNAPCENVCPVAATEHSPDGLNDMAYNRCVGTRYCANNCPYKVRRFNFFNYRDHVADGYYQADSIALLANPEVTVRSRGVMEKCTFCVQRIHEEKDLARKEGRDPDGDRIITACQEACPANAIVFGDINQKDGQLHKYIDHELVFYSLEETNVRPNISYITKLKNTHSEDQA